MAIIFSIRIIGSSSLVAARVITASLLLTVLFVNLSTQKTISSFVTPIQEPNRNKTVPPNIARTRKTSIFLAELAASTPPITQRSF